MDVDVMYLCVYMLVILEVGPSVDVKARVLQEIAYLLGHVIQLVGVGVLEQVVSVDKVVAEVALAHTLVQLLS